MTCFKTSNLPLSCMVAAHMYVSLPVGHFDCHKHLMLSKLATHYMHMVEGSVWMSKGKDVCECVNAVVVVLYI